MVIFMSKKQHGVVERTTILGAFVLGPLMRPSHLVIQVTPIDGFIYKIEAE